MSFQIIHLMKKLRTFVFHLVGWLSLIYLWYKFMFSHNGIHITVNAMKVITLWIMILLILCLLWNIFNFEKIVFHTDFKSHFIRIKVKDWTWAEVTFDANDNAVDSIERVHIICKQKEFNLSPSKRHSYSALLIRDGYVKEAIGFLRQMLSDPYIGQLARKIVESELDLIFMEGNMMNRLKECSIADEATNIDNKQFQISILGYSRKQVDEFLHELLIYCWNLEEENKTLANDLINYNKDTQIKYISYISNAKWIEKEYSLLLGQALQEDVLDYKGNVICEKNTMITSQLIENLISKGLYGELVSATDPSKGVERNAR